jgi:5,5'-dehydrodivanillate O-demethylase
MIEAEENVRFTSVGPDTAGGRLLRHYWYPVATEERLQTEPVLPVRLLGENIVVFRDGRGRLGALAERCPHRGASLAYGFPEIDGLRCPYHGWMFDIEGECLETPNTSPDSPRFRAECSVGSYPVQTLGGLVFVYLGSLPAPALPRYDLLTREENETTFRDIGYAVIPCNWLQIMENSCDPIHVEWLHGRYFNYHLERVGEEATEVLGGHHVRIGIDLFEHGLIKRRLREGQSEEHDDWKVGHPVVFPNILKVGGRGMGTFQIRVPMDDENTLHFWYVIFTVPDSDREMVEQVRRLPSTYEVQIQDPSGRFLVNTIDSQDAMAWVTQGRITDRSNEHLCSSDRGVIVFRNMLREQLEASEAGRLPMNVIPDDGTAPAVLPLPMEEKALGIGGGRQNYFAEYLRTQSLYSHRVRAAVRFIDESLGRPPRDLQETSA